MQDAEVAAGVRLFSEGRGAGRPSHQVFYDEAIRFLQH